MNGGFEAMLAATRVAQRPVLDPWNYFQGVFAHATKKIDISDTRHNGRADALSLVCVDMGL